MRWSLWAVRAVIIAVDLLIAAIIVLSVLPLATGDLTVNIPEGGENEPTMDGQVITMTFPVDISNYGYFSINDLTLLLQISKGDLQITEQRSQPVDIPTGKTSRVNLELSLDLDNISDEALKDLVFNRTTLLMNVGVEAGYSLGLVKASIDMEEEMEWEPLISDYNIDVSGVRTVTNGSNVNVIVPYSFSASEFIQGRELGISSQLVNSTGTLGTVEDEVVIQGSNAGEMVLVISQEAYSWYELHPQELTLKVDLGFEGATLHQEAGIYLGGLT